MTKDDISLPFIEIFNFDPYFIFYNEKEDSSLWWHKTFSTLQIKTGFGILPSGSCRCIGICYGIIGKVQLSQIVEPRLVLIRQAQHLGRGIFKIQTISFLHKSQETSLQDCPKHLMSQGGQSEQKTTLAKTLGVVKAASNTLKSSTQQAASKLVSRNNKVERRFLEELAKIFNDTDSFYFSPTRDLTNCLQRQPNRLSGLPLWQLVDDRFFWNKFMLQDVINVGSPLCDPWIIPIIQGFVQIESCQVEPGLGFQEDDYLVPKLDDFWLMLISRRSRHRAGTRYKRRGVDEEGHCANYVETEQIVEHGQHALSFVQIRGSVPVFWSQPGYKYRPPPTLLKGPVETQAAFNKHFAQEKSVYGPICIVNLVEQSGKEKVIWDAYTNHILAANDEQIIYATFDFHEHWGMHFENVSFLLEALHDVIKSMSYCWSDKQGIICKQTGIFRVNCIDCLDRTNVVQTAIGKAVFESQLTKLGLIVPEGEMSPEMRATFQLLWANNGDIISRQYAGTNALKGDYTRTGERKLSGLMRDGMNSANRYYLSRFKDAQRQATIDVMLGLEVSEDVFSDGKVADDEDAAATVEHVKILLEDCKKLLINDPSEILGCWGLIDADLVTGDPSETEIDSILILTKYAYYVAEYDDQVDRVSKYQRVSLRDIRLLEVGPLGNGQAALAMFKKQLPFYCLRIQYSIDGEIGYFHTFRSTNLRFFNNVAVYIHSPDEMLESLRAIAEAFSVALDVAGLPNVPVKLQENLERVKSRMVKSDCICRLGSYLEVGSSQGISRNASETQLIALKTVGTKALTNLSQQFFKMGRLGQSLRRSQPKTVEPPKFSIEEPQEVEEEACEAFHQFISNSPHWHLPSVGLIMGEKPNNVDFHEETRPKLAVTHARTHAEFDPQILRESQLRCQQSATSQPKKLIRFDKTVTPETSRNFLNLNLNQRSTSERNINLMMATSQSENALKSLKSNLVNVITSPSAAREMLSPLSKLAKGMQSLDLRRLRSETQYRASESHLEEVKKLHERWAGCPSRLIAL